MKGWGGTLLIVGIFVLVAALGMDTSVATSYGRVNNLGLMKDQQNYILIGSLLVVVGLAMMLISRGSPDRDGSARPSQFSKTCPECAEAIKEDAKVCRFCGNREFPVIPKRPPPKRTLFDVLVWDRTQDRP